MNIKIDVSGIAPWVKEADAAALTGLAGDAQNLLLHGKGKGAEFTGWVNLPSEMEPSLIQQVQQVAKRLAGISEVCVVTGIGGSYLGSRAVIEALQHSFQGLCEEQTSPVVIFAGHQLSSDYMADLFDLLKNKEYSVIIISKSGTTTEPAIAFRLLKAHLENKYGKTEACSRIVAITDRERGALKNLADQEGYEQFIVPDDVGGRYSVLTPVGLLPIAVAGFDIEKLMEGARVMQKHLAEQTSFKDSVAFQYACARNACYTKGFLTEILVNYEPRLFYLTEWWKQLYGESEGKEGKGIFPAGVSFTSDLHSMGQYIQEGERRLFETVISVEHPTRVVKVPANPDDADGLNFIAGKALSEINHMAEIGTFLAHNDGGVPVIRIQIPEINEYSLGQLLYFFEFSCAISGYMLGVNPFDQPGVEAYKKNMFALLAKPGFEKQTLEIRKRISNK